MDGDQKNRDGGSDVCPHDDACGLDKIKKPGVHKPHHHDRGGGTGLDERCHKGTYRHSLQGTVGEPSQNELQPGPGSILQTVSHHIHAI